jgi:PAS domain S-box-containing protein
VENGIDLNQKEFHDLLFLQSPFGMVITDTNSYTLDANHRACEILGYSKDQLIGLRGKDIIHPDDISKISTAEVYDLLKQKN